MLSAEPRKVLINALTGQVGSSTKTSGYPTLSQEIQRGSGVRREYFARIAQAESGDT
jgi:hypothetical protein